MSNGNSLAVYHCNAVSCFAVSTYPTVVVIVCAEQHCCCQSAADNIEHIISVKCKPRLNRLVSSHGEHSTRKTTRQSHSIDDVAFHFENNDCHFVELFLDLWRIHLHIIGRRKTRDIQQHHQIRTEVN